MKHFMTYKDVVVCPGPTLNLIVGPNGSGKSTIVCALCLGLGGSPKILGRGEDIVDFISHGCEKASIEITLCGRSPTQDYVVKREIFRERRGATKFYLQGQPTTQDEVRSLVASLNIRVDNLTTFLPQDRVGAFARAPPAEILKEVEKAYGDRQLAEMHDRLIEYGQGVIDCRGKKSSLEGELATKSQELAELQAIVERVARREELRQKEVCLWTIVPSCAWCFP